MLGHRTSNSLVDRDLELVHGLGARIFGGAKDQLVIFANVDEA